MPCNYRLFKKVFDRNFPEGKNGTGQIIIKRDELELNYSKLFEKMLDNEKKIINETEKQVKILLFKDKLFLDFCESIKTLDLNPNLNKLNKYIFINFLLERK